MIALYTQSSHIMAMNQKHCVAWSLGLFVLTTEGAFKPGND